MKYIFEKVTNFLLLLNMDAQVSLKEGFGSCWNCRCRPIGVSLLPIALIAYKSFKKNSPTLFWSSKLVIHLIIKFNSLC